MTLKPLLAFAAVVAAIGLAGASNDVRDYMVQTNRSPKKSDYSVWDKIMVRDAVGRLQPWSLNGVVASSTCDDCKTVVRYVGVALKDGEKAERYQGLLRMLCGYLSGDERDACLNIVNNFPAVIKAAEQMVKDPEGFCKTIDLCDTAVPRPIAFLVRYAAARTRSNVQANDVVCDECVFAADEVKSLIEDKSFQEQAKGTLEGLCSYLGGSAAHECQSVVEQYFQLAWDELVSLFGDGHSLCTDLGLCKNARSTSTPAMRLAPAVSRVVAEHTLRYRELPFRATPRLSASVRFLESVKTKDGLGAGCIICKVSLTGMLDFFKSHPDVLKATAEKLQTVVCNVLPKAYYPDCEDFLTLYLQPVLMMTVEQIKPDAWCDSLSMCKSDSIRRIEQLSASQRGAVVCEACTVIAELAQHELGDRAIQDDLVHTVEKVCADLPADVTEQCKSVVETYAPTLFETAAEELNPMVVCPALHLCPESKAAKTPVDL